MKKVLFIPLVFMVCALNAQATPEKNPNYADHKEMTSEQKALLKTKKMTLALDLDEVQQDKMEALQLQQISKRDQMRQAHHIAGNERSRKDLSADEKFVRESERLDHMIAFKQEIKNILSPEQYAKWSEMQAYHKKGRNYEHSKSGRHSRRTK